MRRVHYRDIEGGRQHTSRNQKTNSLALCQNSMGIPNQSHRHHQSNALVLLTLTSTVLTMPSDASNGSLAFGFTGFTDALAPPESNDEYFITRLWSSSAESPPSYMESPEPAVARRRSGSGYALRLAEIGGRECCVLWLKDVILDARISILCQSQICLVKRHSAQWTGQGTEGGSARGAYYSINGNKHSNV